MSFQRPQQHLAWCFSSASSTKTVGRFSSKLGFLAVLVKSLSLLYKETSLRHAPWPVLMRDFPWIMSITALKGLGYSGDCRVPQTDHLLVEMLQYK